MKLGELFFVSVSYVFCANVEIYFNKVRRASVMVGKFAQRLFVRESFNLVLFDNSRKFAKNSS